MAPLKILIIIPFLCATVFSLRAQSLGSNAQLEPSSPGWETRNFDNLSPNGLPLERQTLFVRFTSTINLQLRQDESGNILAGIAAIDTLNERFGCVAMIKRFKGKTRTRDYDQDKSYILKFRTGIDVISARSAYLATGKFERIDYNEIIAVNGGYTSFVPNDARYARQWGLNNDSVTIKNAFPTAPAAKGADISM